MRRAKRVIAFAIVLGVITTILLAWTCGLCSPPDPSQRWGGTWSAVREIAPGQFAPRGAASVMRQRGFGVKQLLVENALQEVTAADIQVVVTMLQEASTAEAAQVAAAMQSGSGINLHLEHGWPLPAMRCDIDHAGGTRGGWSFASLPSGVSGTFVRAIAWRPMWPGCLINSAIFTLAWLLGLTVPGALRRVRRRRRGACEHCGYDLRGTSDPRCPECGTPRPQKHREALPTEAPRETS